MFKMFKKDDYIVLLKCRFINCGQPSFKENYCYKLRKDNYFAPYLDNSGSAENGWGIVTHDCPQGISSNGPRIAWRYATKKEIEKYEFLKKPFNTYNRSSLIQKLLDYKI